jgi:class 3 adenylate cyclase/predicted ATPase/ABC-type transport system involved in cytochrome c biogenesis ATPase subunit
MADRSTEVHDLGRWLRSVGLEQYAERFAKSDVDMEVLQDLTEIDLEKLGVSLGHRKKLRRAIEALSAAAAGPAPAPPRVRSAAERRHLTVMICDLVGSTGLSRSLDPEDMREVIGGFQQACAAAITGMEGVIAKFMGDGLLAYFGYPKSHEDDAERAIRAGLAIVETVPQIASRSASPLQVRVGIATGLVVVGDIVGEGAAQERAVVGDTPNMAARLESLAEPNTVVISEATRRLLGKAFACVDLGELAVRGIAEPVRAWRVLGEGKSRSRFEAMRSEQLSEFVGRDEEMALLFDRWGQASQGKGQIVLLSGEAGIGKSRIADALRRAIAAQPHLRIRYQCSPYHTNSAFHPVTAHLQHAAGLSSADTTEEKLDKLEALLRRFGVAVEPAAALLATLLSIRSDERYAPPQLTPKQQKDLIVATLGELMARVTERAPVLMLIEDAQWVDPSTLELFSKMFDPLRCWRLLALVTYRPEFQPPWASRDYVTRVTLDRLSHRDAAAMLDKIIAGKPLPPEVREQIVLKTDGVPLFIEELVKTVLESGLLREEEDRFVLTGPLPSLAIPTTLQDSLMARLDRLQLVKHIAQVGATVGRQFSYEMVAAVCQESAPALLHGLQQLVDSGLVFARGTAPDSTYIFKHALVQDAAYESLLRSTRQQLHARIAATLKRDFPDQAEAEPEVLAYHYTQAGMILPAVDHWQKAGELSLMRSALAEACRHLGRAGELLSTLPSSRELATRALDVQILLGQATMSYRGSQAVETTVVFEKAQRLIDAAQADTSRRMAVLYGMWTGTVARSELAATRGWAEQFLDLAEGQPHTGLKSVGHRLLGVALWLQGDLAAARQHLERAVALYDPDAHDSLAYRFGQNIGAAAMCFLGIVLGQSGYPDQAGKSIDDAIACARRSGHLYSLVYTLILGGCGGRIFMKDVAGADRAIAEMVPLAEEHGLMGYLVYAPVLIGWVKGQRGQLVDAIAMMRRGMGQIVAARVLHVHTYYLGQLAALESAAGQPDAALATVQQALAAVDATGECWAQAELRRVQGVIAASATPPRLDEAERCMRTAIDIARARGAKMFELRAATSLAKLLRDRQRRPEARDVLAPIYRWYTEGFESPDLQEAKAMLDGLA